jgi:alkylhydroperoxidase family enzyme
MHEVAGEDLRFPRLALEDLDPSIRTVLAPIAQRVGYFGDFFAVLGHCPAAIAGFMDYTKAVKAPLTDRQNELIALTVCARTGAEYERIQHEWLSLRLGLQRSWIAEVTGREQPAPSTLDADDLALAALAAAMLDASDPGVGDALAAVRARLGDVPALAAVLQVARFMMIATILRAFDMKLPIRSPLED